MSYTQLGYQHYSEKERQRRKHEGKQLVLPLLIEVCLEYHRNPEKRKPLILPKRIGKYS
jgi:hypothetical protein